MAKYLKYQGLPMVAKLGAILTDAMMKNLCAWIENVYNQSDIAAILAVDWPKELRRVSGPLYRGRDCTLEELQILKEGGYLWSRGASWTEDMRIAESFAADSVLPSGFNHRGGESSAGGLRQAGDRIGRRSEP